MTVMDMPVAAANGNGSGGGGEITRRPVERAIVCDDGQFSMLLDTNRFDHLWRVAQLFSRTQLIPEHFRNHPEDCFIAISMAIRLGVDPLMMLQNTYIVYGKPGMEAKLAIALINSSGLFTDPLDYEIVGGDNPKAEGYKVRAFANRKNTGKRVEGPWVDWQVVRSEGWLEKKGSKWQTIPGLMFQYRAATFFGRLHCPERLMGMQTVDELKDVAELAAPPAKGNTLVSRLQQPHPTNPAQTIDHGDNNLTPDEAQKIIEQAPRAPETTDPDVSGVEAEPTPPDLSTHQGFVAAMTAIAPADANVDAALARLTRDYAVAKPGPTGTAARKKIYDATVAGAVVGRGSGRMT